MREPKNQTKSYRKAMAISRRLSKKPTPGGVKAWAELADKSRERIMIRPRGKCQLAGIVEIMNAELTKFEEEHGQPAIAAGFTAIAR